MRGGSGAWVAGGRKGRMDGGMDGGRRSFTRNVYAIDTSDAGKVGQTDRLTDGQTD